MTDELVEKMARALAGFIPLPPDKSTTDAATAALTALRETHHLIPKDQEPVGWLHIHERGEQVLSCHRLTEADKKYGWAETPLYSLPEKPND